MSKLKTKFNKKWFENYWFYYKIHTIAGLFILFIAIVTLVECANTVKPDSTVTYFGSLYFDENFADNFKNELSQYIDDINGDGIKNIFFSALTLTDEVKSEQDIAMQQKAQLEIAVGDTFLYLMDEKYYNRYKNEGLFLDISQYLGTPEPTYGFLVGDSAISKKLGIKEDAKIYACVRVLTQGDEKKQNKVNAQNNAIKIITELYKKD